jgi:HSP20 family protein
MNLIRWDPFRGLEGIQARLDRLYNLPARLEDETFFANWNPRVDIQETDNEFVLKADLPDVRKEDVKVEFDDGVLTVEGERKQEKEDKGKRFYKVEREYGSLCCRPTSTASTPRPNSGTAFCMSICRKRSRPNPRPSK